MYDSNCYITNSKDMHDYLNHYTGMHSLHRRQKNEDKCFQECDYSKRFSKSKITDPVFKYRGEHHSKIKIKQNMEHGKRTRDVKKEQSRLPDPRLEPTSTLSETSSLDHKSIYNSVRNTLIIKKGYKKNIQSNSDLLDSKNQQKCEEDVKKTEATKKPVTQSDNICKTVESNTPAHSSLSGASQTVFSETQPCEKKCVSEPQNNIKQTDKFGEFDQCVKVFSASEENKHDSEESVDQKQTKANSKSNISNYSLCKLEKSLRVFPALSEADFKNIWIRKPVVKLYDIYANSKKIPIQKITNPCKKSASSSRKNRKRKRKCVSADLLKKEPVDVSDPIICDQSKNCEVQNDMLNINVSEVDDTKTFTPKVICTENLLFVDPKVMSMSHSLQKACINKTNASSLVFDDKKVNKSIQKYNKIYDENEQLINCNNSSAFSKKHSNIHLKYAAKHLKKGTSVANDKPVPSHKMSKCKRLHDRKKKVESNSHPHKTYRLRQIHKDYQKSINKFQSSTQPKLKCAKNQILPGRETAAYEYKYGNKSKLRSEVSQEQSGHNLSQVPLTKINIPNCKEVPISITENNSVQRQISNNADQNDFEIENIDNSLPIINSPRKRVTGFIVKDIRVCDQNRRKSVKSSKWQPLPDTHNTFTDTQSVGSGNHCEIGEEITKLFSINVSCNSDLETDSGEQINTLSKDGNSVSIKTSNASSATLIASTDEPKSLDSDFDACFKSTFYTDYVVDLEEFELETISVITEVEVETTLVDEQLKHVEVSSSFISQPVVSTISNTNVSKLDDLPLSEQILGNTSLTIDTSIDKFQNDTDYIKKNASKHHTEDTSSIFEDKAHRTNCVYDNCSTKVTNTSEIKDITTLKCVTDPNSMLPSNTGTDSSGKPEISPTSPENIPVTSVHVWVETDADDTKSCVQSHHICSDKRVLQSNTVGPVRKSSLPLEEKSDENNFWNNISKQISSQGLKECIPLQKDGNEVTDLFMPDQLSPKPNKYNDSSSVFPKLSAKSLTLSDSKNSERPLSSNIQDTKSIKMKSDESNKNKQKSRFANMKKKLVNAASNPQKEVFNQHLIADNHQKEKSSVPFNSEKPILNNSNLTLYNQDHQDHQDQCTANSEVNIFNVPNQVQEDMDPGELTDTLEQADLLPPISDKDVMSESYKDFCEEVDRHLPVMKIRFEKRKFECNVNENDDTILSGNLAKLYYEGSPLYFSERKQIDFQQSDCFVTESNIVKNKMSQNNCFTNCSISKNQTTLATSQNLVSKYNTSPVTIGSEAPTELNSLLNDSKINILCQTNNSSNDDSKSRELLTFCQSTITSVLSSELATSVVSSITKPVVSALNISGSHNKTINTEDEHLFNQDKTIVPKSCPNEEILEEEGVNHLERAIDTGDEHFYYGNKTNVPKLCPNEEKNGVNQKDFINTNNGLKPTEADSLSVTPENSCNNITTSDLLPIICGPSKEDFRHFSGVTDKSSVQDERLILHKKLDTFNDAFIKFSKLRESSPPPSTKAINNQKPPAKERNSKLTKNSSSHPTSKNNIDNKKALAKGMNLELTKSSHPTSKEPIEKHLAEGSNSELTVNLLSHPTSMEPIDNKKPPAEESNSELTVNLSSHSTSMELSNNKKPPADESNSELTVNHSSYPTSIESIDNNKPLAERSNSELMVNLSSHLANKELSANKKPSSEESNSELMVNLSSHLASKELSANKKPSSEESNSELTVNLSSYPTSMEPIDNQKPPAEGSNSELTVNPSSYPTSMEPIDNKKLPAAKGRHSKLHLNLSSHLSNKELSDNKKPPAEENISELTVNLSDIGGKCDHLNSVNSDQINVSIPLNDITISPFLSTVTSENNGPHSASEPLFSSGSEATISAADCYNFKIIDTSSESNNSDETLIYSCDENDEVDKEITPPKKVKRQKRKKVKISEVFRKEMFENDWKDPGVSIRKRKRSLVDKHYLDEFSKRKNLKKSLSESPPADKTMQGTICSSNMDSERLRMELPLHNWLEHKLRQESIRKESIRSFEDEVVSDSDSQNFVFKKKSKHVTMKDKPCVVKNKDINIKHLESKTKSSEVITSNVESDKTKDLAPKDFVLKDLSPEGLAPKDLAPEDLATKTKSNDDAVKVSCEVKDSLDCNRNRMTDISHRNNYQNEKASAYIKTDSGTIADSNNWSNTFIEVDLTTDDEQPLVINESSNSDSKQTNLSPLSVQQEKESAQNMDLPDVLIIDEMSSIKAEIPCSKFKISDTKRVLQANTKQSKNNTESLRSTDVQPGLNDLKTNGNLTSEQPADSQPLNLSVRKSVDITSKPQKPLPKIQLVHPQIVSSKTMKTAEETGIIQSTKMLLNSVESTDTSNQGVPYSSDTVNETVYDLSNNAHSNNTENRENFTNETCMGLLESTHSAAGVSSNSVLREDVEFQKQVNELKQLEYLARKKEKEHAQVLALSRMKLESIMKLKLEKKRAAALNLSSASEAARSTLHDTALASRSTLHDTALASISATKSSSLICPEKTMAEKNKDVTEERPTADRIIKTEIMEQEIIKTEKMEDSDQSDRNNTSSTCTEDRAGTCTEDRASTCTEDQAGESTTQTNVSEYKKITNEIHQAMQAHKKTFKNPKQDSRTLQSPLPAHQSERQLIPEVDPCRLPVDASTVSPRLRTTELPDPFVKAQHNIHKAPIQLAHCQPAFQSAGSLIVPNVQNIQNADLPPFNNNCSKSKVKKSYKTRESGHQNVEPTDLQNKSLPRSEKRKINLSDSFTDQELPRKSPPPLKKAKTRGNISTEIASSNRRLHVLKNPFDDSHTQRQRVEHNSLNQAGLILPHTSASHLNQDHYQFQQNQMNYPPRSIHQQQLIRPALTAFSGAQGVRHPFYDKSSQMSTQSVKSPQPVYPNRPALPVEHNYPGMRQIGREQMNRQMQQMRYQVPSPPMNHARAVPPLHGNLEPGEIVTNHFRPGQYSSLANSLKDQPNTDNRLFHMQHQLGMNNLRMIRHVLPQHMVRHPVIPENHRQSSFEQNALINRGFQQLRPIAPQPHHSNPVFSSQEDSNRYHLAQMAQHREHEQYSKKNLQQKPMSHSSYSAVKAPNMTVTPPQKCSVCGKPSAFVCSRCRQSWYCNEACQNTHWKIHSQSCRDS